MLVTGASGFVGGRVARALTAAGWTVLPTGRRGAGALRAPLDRYRAWDLAVAPLPGVDDAEAVVHCAAAVGDWGPEAAFRRGNVDATRHALASVPGAPFVYVSTSSVYSDAVRTVAVREDAPTGDCAHSAYARTKAEAERVALADGAATGRRVVVLRPHIVYGPGDTTLLPRVLAARRGGRLPIVGRGRQHVSATHVDNLAHAVRRALAVRDAVGAFNVADAEPVPLAELLVGLLARLGHPTRLLPLPPAVAWSAATLVEAAWRAVGAKRGPPLTRYAVGQLAGEHTLDLTRARERLGYAPRWSWRDGPLWDDATAR